MIYKYKYKYKYNFCKGSQATKMVAPGVDKMMVVGGWSWNHNDVACDHNWANDYSLQYRDLDNEMDLKLTMKSVQT